MPCPDGQIVRACDYPQFLVDQTPYFDELIMEDIRPTDGWLLNVSTGTLPTGTPVEITQDRFRSVFPDLSHAWTPVVSNGVGCTGNPCDPEEHRIGYGAERITYSALQQSWQTDLFCYDQDMHITHAEQHLAQVISKILRPATTTISSNFLRKRALDTAKYHHVANANMDDFTFVWAGISPGEEIYLDTSVDPDNVFKLVPQMLQFNYELSMLEGYGGENPFSDVMGQTIELVSDMDTIWELDRLGGQQGVGPGNTPNVIGNWRFESWNAAREYWRYGFSGQIGNYMVRPDPMGLRFNFLVDLGAGAAPNRYRYQVVFPFRNVPTSGAGGAAGIGSDVNTDFRRAHFGISWQWHKKSMELLVPDATPLNPEMPFGHRDFGGKWQWVMDNLGQDSTGRVIQNKRRNKGQFIADFKYWVRPLHNEFARAYFHKREPMCIPEINTCSTDPGYPAQSYNSANTVCPVDE